MKRLLLCALLLAFTGCCHRAVAWYRLGANEQDFYREYSACEQAEGAHFCLGGVACIAQATEIRERWERCMRGQGWIPQEHCRRRGEQAQTYRASVEPTTATQRGH